MNIFNRKPKPPVAPLIEDLHRTTVATKPKGAGIMGIMGAINKVPILGELSQIGPLIPKVIDIFTDHSGRMSSKRIGAGAFSVAGIAMVQAGAAANSPMQFWGGLILCGMAVALFFFTRYEQPNKDAPEDIQ